MLAETGFGEIGEEVLRDTTCHNRVMPHLGLKVPTTRFRKVRDSAARSYWSYCPIVE